MSDDTVPYTYCYVCRKQLTLMKRCTRCKTVIYCSRTCQVQDWHRHKEHCGSDEGNTIISSPGQITAIYTRNDNSIFMYEDKEPDSHSRLQTGRSAESPTVHPPLVDFSKAVKKVSSSNSTDEKPDSNSANQTTTHSSETYLCDGEFHSDLPKSDENAPCSEIVIKCNKVKHKLSVQNSWTGEEIFKHLSYSLTVPLDKLKLIHKGKVLTKDNIMETIKDKAVYIAFGEKAESADGIDQRDITVMMQQMGVDRNKAIQTLKQKGDLIDALLS